MHGGAGVSRRGTATAALAMALLALAASGEVLSADAIYRWIDRNGRVNYGNTPPSDAKAERIDGGSLMVVPAPPARPAEPSDTTRRVERLEAELEQEKRLRREAEERADEQRASEEASRRAREKARADCEDRFREPCDEEGRPIGPRYIVVPSRPWPPPLPPRDGHPPRPDGDRHDPRPLHRGVPAPDGMPKPVLPINPERAFQAPRPTERRLPSRHADD